MLLLQEQQLSAHTACSYIDGLTWRFDYFFAMDLNQQELNSYLKQGWRKFGAYFFRPNCPHCNKCIPLRVLVNKFLPSKSQRRVLKNCKHLTIKLNPLQYNDVIFEIYKNHSLNKFKRESDKEEFISTFYTVSCPSLQSEYYFNDELIAVGFIDISNEAFSSVYFIYHTKYEKLSLGTYSIIKEIELAAALKLKYYYLGFYIEENSSMNYKNKFKPYEYYKWDENKWTNNIKSCFHI